MAFRSIAVMILGLGLCSSAAAMRKASSNTDNGQAMSTGCPPKASLDGKKQCLDAQTGEKVAIECCSNNRDCRAEFQELQMEHIFRIASTTQACALSPDDLRTISERREAEQLDGSKACALACMEQVAVLPSMDYVQVFHERCYAKLKAREINLLESFGKQAEMMGRFTKIVQMCTPPESLHAELGKEPQDEKPEKPVRSPSPRDEYWGSCMPTRTPVCEDGYHRVKSERCPYPFYRRNRYRSLCRAGLRPWRP